MRRFFGWLMCIVGAAFVAGMFHDLLTHGENLEGAVIAGVFFGGVGVAGVQLLRSGRSKDAPALPPRAGREALALKHAQQSAGLLGVASLAASAGMTYAEAQATLDDLARQGACELVVAESGSVLYRFPDFVALASGEPPKLLE